jgi:YD repeat-containing protein
MKFAEYVACGVPVLASAGIGDLDGMISAYGVGRVLAAPEEAGRALGSLKFSYDGADRLLREHYSWAGAVKKLQWLYEHVLAQYARTG